MQTETTSQPSAEPVRGYKVFNKDFTCRGYQYAEGTEFIHQGEIELCETGFHFCRNAADCFSYYSFDSDNIVCEVAALGKVEHGDDKSVTDHLHIVRRVEWSEVLTIVNTGKANSGHRNSGHRNSGHRNSGYSNSGDSNSGHSNSGDRNSGDWNSGDSNSGYSNSGHSNSGDRNSGDSNSGDRNSGDWNSGDSNSGHSNSGHSNSGHRNSGHRNSGDSNSGHSNSGHRNSGHRNSGHRNSGYSNSGDWNSTRCSSGVFNSKEAPILMFNKPSTWTYSEWRSSDACRILSDLVLEQWVWFDSMTDQEKIDHPKAYVTDGYLKHFRYKHACRTLWDKLTERERKTVQELPNFDAAVFFEITGIEL